MYLLDYNIIIYDVQYTSIIMQKNILLCSQFYIEESLINLNYSCSYKKTIDELNIDILLNSDENKLVCSKYFKLYHYVT